MASRKGMKLKTLTLADKMKLLDRVDAGATMRKVCEEFDIKPSTFYDIKKSRDKIRKHSLGLEEPVGARNSLKRIKVIKHADLDGAVYRWYKQQRTSNVNVRGVDIQHAAVTLARCMEIKDFVASSGWLYNFKSRHCLGKRKIVGEAASADEQSIAPFRKKLEKIPAIGESHTPPSQVYNVEETDIHYKAAPSNTQTKKHEKRVPRRKVPKDHLSITASGDEAHHLVSKSRITTQANAWLNLLMGTGVIPDFTVINTRDIVERLHRAGKMDVAEENVKAWLNMDARDRGFHHDELEEIAGNVIDHPDKLSELMFHLDKAVELMGQVPDLDNHCQTLRSIRTEVVKRQHSRIEQAGGNASNTKVSIVK